MSQEELNEAVARATGESVSRDRPAWFSPGRSARRELRSRTAAATGV